ncbi:uncharacterized protein K452DRAFT_305712 [Aplosporella prunicola CBS 121167]|uniref:Septation initiation network scaffold protein cdc11 n=1 Tax=Aplosporella prunicola CBS 121167 TaxID=1176127 RepID=A0A6A6BSE9_9PEZI|nr:uncharacterized protein K452DRAFT_305712 [Aplosporella prunicola CBS 121167]KAF2145747.1 hypothetical protein K452DRAFT_305712 [Aplosporella prunicola CBS 121167]
MSNLWLDDLSEDWIPQPSPSDASSVSSASHDSVQIKSPARSRVPRLRSSPDAQTTPKSDNFSRPLPGKRKAALAERSQSDNNIALPTNSSAPEDQDAPDDPPPPPADRSPSASSSDSVVQYGTVEQKAPPNKANKSHDTPEWKRRLIQGKMGYGEQRDLFSPMGLENIFQKPPTQRAPGSKKKSRLPLFKDMSALPSSPPPWPTGEAHAKDSVIDGQTQEKAFSRAPDGTADGSDADDSAEDSFGEYDNDSDAGSVVHNGYDAKAEAGEDTFQPQSFHQTDEARASHLHPGHEHEDEKSRATSGQTDLADETFSPVFISKHNTTDGGVDYAAIDLTKSQLARLRDQIGEKESPNKPDFNASQGSDSSSFAKLRSETLPEDLLAGTPDQLSVGQFVNLKRGGFSADGSFMRRPLSPSPLGRKLSSSNVEEPTPVNHKNETGQPIPQVYRPPSVFKHIEAMSRPMSPPISPKTPALRLNSSFLNPDRNASFLSPDRPTPLKLFGDHDTFTAARLHRRMSQLEDTIQLQENAQDSKKSSLGSSPAKRNIEGQSRLPSVEEASFQKNDAAANLIPEIHEPIRESAASYFGQGDLNEYPFPDDEFSFPSSRDAYEQDSGHQGPPSRTSSKGTPPKFMFSVDDGEQNTTTRMKRKLSRQSVKSWTTTLSNKNSIKIPKSPRVGSRNSDSAKKGQLDLLNVTEVSEGKRPPTSPFKNPTPKRRRTLLSSDLMAYSEPIPQLTPSSPATVETDPSKKRTRVREENLKHTAEPDVLARRTILRPRNPTPSQRRREQIQADILDATDAYLMSTPRLHAIQEHLESPTSRDISTDGENERAIAGEIAAFSIRLNKGMRDEERKRSVTTQDFLDEARLIMDHIRAKGRPNSALESLTESSPPGTPTRYRSPFTPGIPSSQFTFSRPPSRSDGARSGWRNPAARSHDQRVVSHLRKYREKDEEDYTPTSLRSFKMPHVEGHDEDSSDFSDDQTENIRILTNKLTNRNRNHGHSVGRSISRRSAPADDMYESRPSTMASSMGRTNYTTFSRRSDNVATLAPEAVAHLIPQEIAGMSFDREKGIWVKRRNARNGAAAATDISNMTNSEDDPLRGIPDLTIDEVEELKRMSQYPPSPSPPKRSYRDEWFSTASTTNSKRGGPTISVVAPSDESAHTTRPRTRDEAEPPLPDPRSSTTAPSKFSTNFSSSDSETETRATSYSEKCADHIKPRLFLQPETIPEIPSSPAVEYEYGISEGRSASQPTPSTQGRINVDHTFASSRNPRPTATARQSYSSAEDAMNYPVIEPGMEDQSQFNPHEPSDASTLKRGPPSHSHSANNQNFQPSANSSRQFTPLQAEGHTELSVVQHQSEQSRRAFRVSLGPVSQGAAPASPSQYAYADVTFMLSELPDFTVNQVDERELPNRTLVKRHVGGNSIINGNEDRFGNGTMELVKALQDVRSREPFWEDMRKVELKDKGLPTLHRLDEMCYRLQELDVSDNHIAQLAGAPPSIRRLNVSGNCLTSLTAWGHLMNLQYLDISGNQIESLKGFSGLIHLRELRADNNQIEGLEGLLGLDGLIKLSLKNNRIRKADFEGAELDRLTDLDLSANEVASVRNLSSLPSLQRLNLDENELARFPSQSTISLRVSKIQKLSLRQNRLESVDLRHFPALVSLDLDSNCLSSISGIGGLHSLRALSARDQRIQGPFDVSSFLANADIHELYLSSNTITTFTLPHSFLNLHCLELASCGLQTLPEKFGQLAPNVRYLNLNFNALKDLRPVLNVKKLDALLLAGNRLARLRRNLLVLAKVASLSRIDLRDNPFSVGFYPPLSKVTAVTARSQEFDDNDLEGQEPNALPNAVKTKDVQYMSRLDEDTKMRRRVYELLLGHSCKGLQQLDGLEFSRKDALSKDKCWDRLVTLGVIKKSSKGKEMEKVGGAAMKGTKAGNE